MPSPSSARNKDQSNRHRAAGPSSCADRMAADQARFCNLRRSPTDPSARAPKPRRTAPDGPPAHNRRPPPARVVSDQLSKDENVGSCLKRIRFVPKMPPLLGHAPSESSLERPQLHSNNHEPNGTSNHGMPRMLEILFYGRFRLLQRVPALRAPLGVS